MNYKVVFWNINTLRNDENTADSRLVHMHNSMRALKICSVNKSNMLYSIIVHIPFVAQWATWNFSSQQGNFYSNLGTDFIQISRSRSLFRKHMIGFLPMISHSLRNSNPQYYICVLLICIMNPYCELGTFIWINKVQADIWRLICNMDCSSEWNHFLLPLFLYA